MKMKMKNFFNMIEDFFSRPTKKEVKPSVEDIFDKEGNLTGRRYTIPVGGLSKQEAEESLKTLMDTYKEDPFLPKNNN